MSQQFSPNGFSILPPIVKNLLIINALLYLGMVAASRFNIDLNDILGLHFFSQ